MGELIRIAIILVAIFTASGWSGIQTFFLNIWEVIKALPMLLFPDGFDLLGFLLDHPYQLTGIILSLLCGVFGIWLGRKGAKIICGIVSLIGLVYSISSLCT
jgi:hypothetical protein